MSAPRARPAVAAKARRLAGPWLASVAALAALLASPAGFAQTGEAAVTEQSLKAAFIYKFLDYVEWPEGALGDVGMPLTIGVAGSRALADELAAITNGRRVGGRPIRVTRVGLDDATDDLQLLFVGRDEDERLTQIVAPARNRPVLTVAESDDAFAAGCIINFVVEDARVRFEISLSEARQSGLELDSRLLAVAKRVYRSPDGSGR